MADRVGTFFNAASKKRNDGQTMAWARRSYPDIWAELMKLGMSVGENGSMVINLDRTVSP